MEEENERNVLVGAKAIARFLNRSIPTVMRLELQEELPIYLVGGIWEGDRGDLYDWIECKKKGEPYERMEKNAEPTQAELTKEEKRARKEEINAILEEKV